MSKPIGAGGKAVLTLGHMAGMIDMVAIPLWIGGLMQHYQFSPQQAGMTVTLFLFGIVVASAVLAPQFNRVPRRWIAAGGFTVAALCFTLASQQPMGAASFGNLVALHTVAGLGAGGGLSLVHGSIGRTDNPHRLFGMVNLAVAAMGIALFATMPGIIAHHGSSSLFVIFAAAMALAALVCLAAFPSVDEVEPAPLGCEGPKLIWMPIAVVICLALNQSMVFAFVERIGVARGFSSGDVQTVLVALAFVNLLPGPLAALLQNRLSPQIVGVIGPIFQAVLALALSNSPVFAAYALATAVYVSTVIFTHTFLFGFLSKHDPSGRAASATPAMMMLGSSLGPAIGGFIVSAVGYQGLGWAACGVSAAAVIFMLQLRTQLRKRATAQLDTFA